MLRSAPPSAALLPRVLLLCLSIFAALPAAAASVNRLENPGFETGLPGHPWMPAGWDTSRSGLSSVFFGRDTLLAHGGEYAVSVANVSALWPFSHHWTQSLLIGKEEWGKDAAFTVWTRSSGVEGRAFVLLQAYRDTISRVAKERGLPRDSVLKIMHIKAIDDPLYDLGWNRLTIEPPETGWEKREIRLFIPPLTNMLFVRCGLIGTGQLMLDDASLTFEPARPAPAVPPHTNLLGNPGFENGAQSWEFSLPPYRNMIGRLDSTVAHGGRHSAFFTGGENGWVEAPTGAFQALPNRNLQGKHVRMSGWFKTDSLRSTAYTKFYFKTLHGVEQVTTKDRFSGNTDWSEATLEADVPRDTYVVWVWYAFSAPAPGRVYIDDCSLEVTEAPAAGRKSSAKH